MYIFRIEDKTGVGPWTSNLPGLMSYFKQTFGNLKGSDKYCDHFLTKRRPDVKEDIEDMTKDYICGISCHSQLLHWFSSDMLIWMEKHEYKLSVYKIHKNQVLFGKYQIAFQIKQAKLIEQLNPSNHEQIKKYKNTFI